MAMVSSVGGYAIDRLSLDDEVQDKKGSDASGNVRQVEEEKPSFGTFLYWATLQKERQVADKKTGASPEAGSIEADLSDLSDSEKERIYARRALRAATWQGAFMLIVTDIIGTTVFATRAIRPSTAPWAISSLGYVPGVFVYVCLAVIAAYTGLLLWRMYMGLDSERYPVRGYGDLADKIYGSWCRHIINVLQAIQLIFNVSVITLGNGQSLSQLSKGRVCFMVLMVIWTVIGMLFAQFKSLQKFSYMGAICVTATLVTIFINMGIVPHSLPNYAGALAQLGVPEGPTVTQIINNSGFSAKLVAIMNIVYAYGGALMFLEFCAEMKRPMDFWKAMICAQSFILFLYLFYGLFIYSYQGQFTMVPANLGISVYSYQSATNVIGLITSLIVASLYGHIGIKSAYHNIVQDIFNGPVITSRRGTVIWLALVVFYWCIAFVIASAIPQFANVSGLVGAICILQFSFGIPPILHFGFSMQRDAIITHPNYDASSPYPVITDGWRNGSWWRRAFSRGKPLKIMNVLLFLAALATGGLGAYASIESIIAGFASGSAATSFTCQGPV